MPRALSSELTASRRAEESQHIGGLGDDLLVPLGTQFAGNGAEDTRSLGHAVLLDDYAGIVVEPHTGAIFAARHRLRAHHNRRLHRLLTHRAARLRLFDRNDDHIADAGVAPVRAAEHADAHALLCTRIIGNVEIGGCLDHFEEESEESEDAEESEEGFLVRCIAASTPFSIAISLTRGTRFTTSRSLKCLRFDNGRDRKSV